MSTVKPIHCFTHHDLDGVATYLVTKWAHSDREVTVTHINTVTAAREKISNWLTNHSFTDYDTVYFLDLDISECTDLIDHPNVIIIDHHKTHVDAMKYTQAKPFVKVYSSACLLAYKVFKKLYNVEFTEPQKKLIALANDYDSYTHAVPESKMLNTVFWNTQKGFDAFCENFKDGFTEFTSQQLAICQVYETELKDVLSKLKIYQGAYVDVDGEYRIIVSTFAGKFVNEVADHVFEQYEADVAIIVYPENNRVSFRRPTNGTMKVNLLAQEIANGGGHEYAAGGQITPAFIEFTKQLKAV